MDSRAGHRTRVFFRRQVPRGRQNMAFSAPFPARPPPPQHLGTKGRCPKMQSVTPHSVLALRCVYGAPTLPVYEKHRRRTAAVVRKKDINCKQGMKEASEGALSFIGNGAADCAHPARAHSAWSPASRRHRLTQELRSALREGRWPDGLFTSNKIILEEWL